MSYNKPIRRIAIVGTGVIGASWAAQFLAKGLQVVATDAELSRPVEFESRGSDAHKPPEHSRKVALILKSRFDACL